MNEFRLTLPWPPSVNHYWRHCRGRNYISAKGMQYRKDIIQLIRQQRLDINTTSRLKFSISFMADDKQIDDFRVRRGTQVKGGSLEVLITELGEV